MIVIEEVPEPLWSFLALTRSVGWSFRALTPRDPRGTQSRQVMSTLSTPIIFEG